MPAFYKSNQFLTVPRFLKGAVCSLLERFFFRPANSGYVFPRYPGYSWLAAVQVPNRENSNSLGVYQNKQGRKTIIKSLNYQTRNLAFEQFINEINVLRVMGRLFSGKAADSSAEYQVSVPVFYEVLEQKHQIAFVREFVEGKLLAEAPVQVKFEVLRHCLKFFSVFPRDDRRERYHTSAARPPLLMLLTFPFYWFAAVCKAPRRLGFYLRLAVIYYQKFSWQSIRHPRYVLAHKDLHSQNIILHTGRIVILDPQVAVYSEEGTDLAISARLYHQELGGENIAKLLQEFLFNNEQRDKFVRLTLFFAFQSLVFDKRLSADYQNTESYLQTATRDIFPLVHAFTDKQDALSSVFISLKDYLFSCVYSATEKVRIEAWHPKSAAIAARARSLIKEHLPNLPVHFVGSASLKILGLKDIDLIAGCREIHLPEFIRSLQGVLGGPRKLRSRFAEWQWYEDGYKIEFSLMDKESDTFQRLLTKQKALKTNKQLRHEYATLKESWRGLSVRDYERAKTRFFRRVIESSQGSTDLGADQRDLREQGKRASAARALPTVTVAVSAFNEGQNIANFLRSVLQQKEDGFTLARILVICDGCTDETAERARSLGSKKIQVREYRVRCGKSVRLNEIYRNLDTDLLVQSDADVTFAHDHVIADLIGPLAADPLVGMAGGHPMPFPGRTFTEKAVNRTFWAYDRLRSAFRGGDNIFSADGRLLAYRSALVKKIRVPENMIANDMFTYFCCLTQRYKYRYVASAVVNFRSPQTLADQIRQNTRFVAAPARMKRYFPSDLVDRERHIPLPMFLRITVREFLIHPLLCSYIVAVNAYCRVKALLFEHKLSARWDMATTTKQLVK